MTIKEIAKLAGVSASTVSKIMNHKDSDINPDTRSRVLKIVKEYNYSPYTSTVQASNVKTFVLGVLVNFQLPSDFLRGILDMASAHGYTVMFFDNLTSPEEELKSITVLCKNNIDGVIWAPLSKESLNQEHLFTKQGIPVQYIFEPNLPDALYLNWEEIGYQATRELLEHHHIMPAILDCPEDKCFSNILQGFKRCLFEYQISFNDSMILPSDIPNAFTQILSKNITGVVCPSCHDAVNLYQYCESMQYHVPEQLSLISFLSEDLPTEDIFPISCLRTPYKEFGKYAALTLIEQCEKLEKSSASFEVTHSLTSTRSIDIPAATKEQKILVIGSINLDVTLSVESLPQSGETVTIQNSSIAPGGKGMNQAVGVSKLNYPVALIGAVGNDYDASLIYTSAQENNMNTNGIVRHNSALTGKAYIQVQDDGEITISILPGANKYLSPDILESKKSLFKNTKYCLVSAEIPSATLQKALQLAKDSGAKTILKPSTMSTIDSEIMKNVDIFIPNRKEAEQLCPQYSLPEERAHYFKELGAKIVIITLGHRGCLLLTDDMEKQFPAVPFVAVNTTGAADAFIAALAVYLSKGYDLEQSIQIATYAAAISITKPEVIHALVDCSTLEKYLHIYMPELLI